MLWASSNFRTRFLRYFTLCLPNFGGGQLTIVGGCISKVGRSCVYQSIGATSIFVILKFLIMPCWPSNASICSQMNFPKDNLLEAYREGCPSYTWRSLWGAKSLLKEGLLWRIGDGVNVKVWEDDWVQCKIPLARPSTGMEFNPDLKVNDLILEGTMEWNEVMIRNLFSKEAGSMILRIPLSSWSPPRLSPLVPN